MAHSAVPPLWPSSVPAAAKPRRSGSASDPTGTVPAQPPLPACRYLPFQPESGSQSSNLISESLVGRAVAWMAQCAGMFDVAAAVVAALTVVWDSFRLVRLSHVCCAKAGQASAE